MTITDTWMTDEMRADVDAELALIAAGSPFHFVDLGPLVEVTLADGTYVETIEPPADPALRAAYLASYRP